MTLGKLAVLALAGLFTLGSVGVVLADRSRSDEPVGAVTLADDQARKQEGDGDDDATLAPAEEEGDGDDTTGDDGTGGGDNTGDGDDTRGNDGTSGGANTGDGDDTAGNDGTSGGANTGDGDGTAGNDGTSGGDNTFQPAPAPAPAWGDTSGGGTSG